ncbi:hypothetical protein, partial [Klebsiella variicola]|uniref:hypothetical protein n=1 Tax=Klebsiella variicola TaxID=244366 RepID=UPI001C5322DD
IKIEKSENVFLTAWLVVDFCQQGKVIHNGGDAERIKTQDEGSGSARRRRPQDSQDDARLGDVSKGKGRNRDRWTLRERQGKSLANRERRAR